MTPNAKKRKNVKAYTIRLSTLERIEAFLPKTLNNKRLIKKYGSLIATKQAYIRGNLSSDYYRGVADAGGVTGKVPKNVFALVNLDYTIEEFRGELRKRGLLGQFDLFVHSRLKGKRKRK